MGSVLLSLQDGLEKRYEFFEVEMCFDDIGKCIYDSTCERLGGMDPLTEKAGRFWLCMIRFWGRGTRMKVAMESFREGSDSDLEGLLELERVWRKWDRARRQFEDVVTYVTMCGQQPGLRSRKAKVMAALLGEYGCISRLGKVYESMEEWVKMVDELTGL